MRGSCRAYGCVGHDCAMITDRDIDVITQCADRGVAETPPTSAPRQSTRCTTTARTARSAASLPTCRPPIPATRRRCGRSTTSHAPLYWFPARLPADQRVGQRRRAAGASDGDVRDRGSRICAAETSWLGRPRRPSVPLLLRCRGVPAVGRGRWPVHLRRSVYPDAWTVDDLLGAARRTRIELRFTPGSGAGGSHPRVGPAVQLRAHPRRQALTRPLPKLSELDATWASGPESHFRRFGCTAAGSESPQMRLLCGNQDNRC